jgi:hypothetical protein
VQDEAIVQLLGPIFLSQHSPSFSSNGGFFFKNPISGDQGSGDRGLKESGEHEGMGRYGRKSGVEGSRFSKERKYSWLS